MPLSTSPRSLPPAEITGDIRPQEDQKLIPSTELSIRTPVSPSASLQSYEETMPMTTPSRALAPSEYNRTQQTSMIFDPEAMQWSAQGHFPHHGLVQDTFCTPSLFAPNPTCNKYAQQAVNDLSYSANSAIKYPVEYTSPRIFQTIDFAGRPSEMAASYPPAAYFHSPPQLHLTPSLPDYSTPELSQLNDDWDMHYGVHVEHEDQHDYNSPYSDMSRASTPYSTGHEEDPIDKEQPYAQLIYRALLDAPDHTMVLRDIYDWFRRHTDKASHSETKGWQNSIRHNLSMNGAFEKVDSPTDATTKGFMWRLTEAALIEGVKSTTRYRSKAPNKRSHRTQPQPQRQASGAKGGHAARRAANLRRSQRARETVMYHRPIPSSDPYSNVGYGSEWEDSTVYKPSSAYSSRVHSPYRQMCMPHTVPRDDAAFSSDVSFPPMLGTASHLVSAPRSYTSPPATPATPSIQDFRGGDAAYVPEQDIGQPLFAGSPTPSADSPVTPVDGHHWEQDVPMGINVYEGLSPFASDV
ncbi:hypothetical protein E8E12_002427 [Didymella heteroderae]|uniref:Fork-head domain-containing protein n=1 Tax=Didymella heteroderae TaxID=1769908 RepID=A0A9P4WQK9_9PLEO|nr:hypothetical protein E8E12_002427 [Didymella heteroderae]